MYDPGSKLTQDLDLTHVGEEIRRLICGEVRKEKLTLLMILFRSNDRLSRNFENIDSFD